MFAARLVAYRPGGSRVHSGMLDGVSWDASFPLDDVAALTLAYPSVFDDAGLVDEPVELAVEVSGGGAWVEPANARFLTSELQSDLTQPLDVPSFTFRGLGALLERPFILREQENPGKPYTSDEDDPKRNFLSATAGQIVLSIVSESKAKYPQMLAGIDLAFTASTDSAGKPWNQLISNAYSAGTDLLRILDDLVGQGNIDWWMQGRSLHVVNADSTSVERDYRLFLGDATESPVRVTWEAMATHIQLEGGQGFYREQAVSGAVVPYGTRVVRIANDSVTTEGTAQSMMNEQARIARSPRREYTRQIADLTTSPFPLVDWHVGDWVEAENYQHQYEQMRVHALGVAWDAKETMPAVRVTLNDRFVDASVREAKRLAGITHGATQILGDGGIPSRVDRAVPAAPKGVTANSLGYWVGAVPYASVDVSWQAVTESVDGLALDGIDYYEVRVGTGTKQASGTSVGFDGLQPSRIYEVRVRAVSSTGIVGHWSAFREVVTDYPPVQLDPPTAPVLSTGLGSIQVEWDGKLQGSGVPYVPPKHFSHVRVETRLVGTTAWVEWPRDHGFVQTGLVAGVQYDVRLFAVDTLGRESLASSVVRVTVQSLVQDALNDADKAARDAAAALSAVDQSVSSTVIEYALSTSRTVAPTSGWTTSTVVPSPSQVVWFRTRVIRVDGSSTTLAPALLTGPDGPQGNPGKEGEPGPQGVSVMSVTPYYRVAVSRPALPSGASPSSWSTTQPSVGVGQKLWQSDRVALSNGSFQWTPVTEVQASTIAANLQTKVEDGLMRVARESQPPAPGKGLTWLVTDSPTGKQAVGLKIATSAGTGWMSYQILVEDLMVVGPDGTIRLRNGVVAAPNIVGGTITGDKMAAGALDAFQITSPLIQSVSTANRGIKWNGSTLIGYTSGGAESFRLDGNRATITGGTIQTHEAVNRGVKLTGNGLYAYDNNGNLTAYITGTSGEITGYTITGGLFRTGLSGNRVVISPSANFSGQPGIRLYSGGSGARDAVFFIADAAGSGGWDPYATVIAGSETTRNSSGRSDLILGHGGDFRLQQQYGTYSGIGVRKDGRYLRLRGELRHNHHSANDMFLEGKYSFSNGISPDSWSEVTMTYGSPPTRGTRRAWAQPSGVTSPIVATVRAQSGGDGVTIRLYNFGSSTSSPSVEYLAISLNTS